jgi:hypothetical protein
MKTSIIYLPMALAAGLAGQTQPGAPSPGSPVEPPTLEHIGAVAPHILAIEIQAGRILPMREVPYRKEAGDQVTKGRNAQTGEIREMRVVIPPDKGSAVARGVPRRWSAGRSRRDAHHAQYRCRFRLCAAGRPLADAAIRKLAVETIVRRADDAVKLSKGGAFGFTTAGRSLSWGALTVPADTALVRAHVLTAKPEYLGTILRSALYSAGANPLNMTMTTGLGHDWPRHLLHEDSRHFGQPAPAGITIYGPSDPVAGQTDNNGWGFGRLQTECTPPVLGWPAMEAYFDVYQWAEQNEFTVYQTMGPTSYVWGYPAARPQQGPLRAHRSGR